MFKCPLTIWMDGYGEIYCYLKITKIDIALSWNFGIKLPSYIIDMLLKIGKDKYLLNTLIPQDVNNVTLKIF